MSTKYYVLFVCLILGSLLNSRLVLGRRKYSRRDLLKLREEVREMFDHAYSGYLKYAYPYDELRPLTCDGVDTWGSYSLTLIDALDTLAVMGNYSEFRRVVDIVTSNANFDANINVSVFETNIRIVGGLISAHLFSQRAGLDLEPGWPCNGPLLRLAEDVARRLLPAFNTKSGMPYGTVNLRYGVPIGETTVTCTAGVGTYILEFATLSRLTGDPIYEEVAMHALRVLFDHRSSIGLYGNHIDIKTGKWVARDSGIGAGVDSFFEYLVKGSILLNRPELMAMFNEARKPIDKYLKKNNWYIWASMNKGQVTLPVFQSLEAYWPGVLTLIGDVETALRSMHNYNSVWKQYGFTPEFYNIPQGQAGTNRESYPLRPELVESAMYLYRATGDPFMLDIGKNILRSIQYSAKTRCGYATIKDARDHSLENRMESFFLAETTKYLYLLFDPDNFIHNRGAHGRLHTLSSGKQCVLDSGAYIFNTEAHPIDASALNCCHDWKQERYNSYSSFNYKGDIIGSTKSNSKGSDGEMLPEEEAKNEEALDDHPSEEKLIVNLPAVHTRRKELDNSDNLETGGNIADSDQSSTSKESVINDAEGEKLSTQASNDEVESLSKDWLKQEKDGKFNNISEHTEHRNKLIKIINNNHQKLMSVIDSLSKSINEVKESSATKVEKQEEEEDDEDDDDEEKLELTNKSTIERAEEPTFPPDEEPKIENTSLDHIMTDGTVSGVTKNRVGENFMDRKDDQIDLMTLTDYVRTLIISPTVPKNKFNAQALLEYVRKSSSLRPTNTSWNHRFDHLTCKAQPFLIRITIAGEFLEEK